jgi:hypothetical protein
VRDLIARALERLLADQLRDLHLARLVASDLLRVVERSFRKQLDERAGERCDSGAGASGDGEDLAKLDAVVLEPGDDLAAVAEAAVAGCPVAAAYRSNRCIPGWACSMRSLRTAASTRSGVARSASMG